LGGAWLSGVGSFAARSPLKGKEEQTYGGLAERYEVGPSKDETGENILDRLCDLENYPDEILAPYEQFVQDGKAYYFTPGGFLYRKDPGNEEVGGFLCGYLTDDVWHYRTGDG
jgi:hypothetical protein